jgi:hypothetical protein
MFCADFPPLVLWRNWQINARLVLRPKPRNRRSDFDAQITKLKLPVLRSKLGNPSHRFWGQTERNRPSGFEAQLRNSCYSSPHARCRSHIMSPDLPIARPPSSRPVLDHPRSFAPGLLLLPRSSLLRVMSHLPPAHHETSKRNSPQEQE